MPDPLLDLILTTKSTYHVDTDWGIRYPKNLVVGQEPRHKRYKPQNPNSFLFQAYGGVEAADAAREFRQVFGWDLYEPPVPSLSAPDKSIILSDGQVDRLFMTLCIHAASNPWFFPNIIDEMVVTEHARNKILLFIRPRIGHRILPLNSGHNIDLCVGSEYITADEMAIKGLALRIAMINLSRYVRSLSVDVPESDRTPILDKTTSYTYSLLDDLVEVQEWHKMVNNHPDMSETGFLSPITVHYFSAMVIAAAYQRAVFWNEDMAPALEMVFTHERNFGCFGINALNLAVRAWQDLNQKFPENRDLCSLDDARKKVQKAVKISYDLDATVHNSGFVKHL